MRQPLSDQLFRMGPVVHTHQNTLSFLGMPACRPIFRHPLIYIIRYLEQGQLAQGGQIYGFKEVIESPLNFVRRINFSINEALLQSFRGDINQSNFTSLFHEPIRNPLAYFDPRNMLDFVMKTLQVLNVHRCYNIDPVLEQI